MPRILKTRQSRADYDEIWDYIANDNPAAADRLIKAFDDKLALLAERPDLGRSRDDLAPSLRSYVVGSYLLFYLPVPDGIELIRVLHGARDIPRVFRSE